MRRSGAVTSRANLAVNPFAARIARRRGMRPGPGDHAARRQQIPFAGEKPHLKPLPLAPYRALLTSAHRRIFGPLCRHPNDGALIVIRRAGDQVARDRRNRNPQPARKAATRRKKQNAVLRKHLETAQSLNGTTSTANPPAKSPAVIAVPAPAAGVPAPAPETTGGEKCVSRAGIRPVEN